LLATPGVRPSSRGSDVAMRCISNATIQGVSWDNHNGPDTINDGNMNPKVCNSFC